MLFSLIDKVKKLLEKKSKQKKKIYIYIYIIIIHVTLKTGVMTAENSGFPSEINYIKNIY